LNNKLKGGIVFTEKKILPFAIALMGVNLNFQILEKLGFKSVIFVIISLSFTLSVTILLAKLLKFDKKFALLIGIGNGVCGSSAIAATEQIIGAKDKDVGLSIAIINFLGTIGMFLLPIFATLILKFSDIDSGILMGNTLQAVGQVVAAGFSINNDVGQTATLVKMTRILMLFPLIIILIVSFTKDRKNDSSINKKIDIPFFIIGFILFSLIPTFNILPGNQIKIIAKISHYALITAMVSIGLKISVQTVLKESKSALFIGSLIFMFQILFTILILFIFF
jgi:uncharacterized integral membrane protein (TIGR00698 family)